MKIVVSDLSVSLSIEDIKRNVGAINDFIRKGNMFILATNKAMNCLTEDLSTINLECEYYICNNGAVIFDRYFNVLYRKDIKQEFVRPIYNKLLNDSNLLEVYIDTSHGYVKDTNKCANGIVARPCDFNKAHITLSKIECEYPQVHGYVDDTYMSIIDANVTKKSALEYLINLYNFNVNDIIATGVSTNDYDLVKKYTSYAFNNSIQDIKDISVKTVSDIKELIDELTATEEKDNDF